MDHTDPVWKSGFDKGREAGREECFDLLAELADFAGENIGPQLGHKERDILRRVRKSLLQCGGMIRAGALVAPTDDQVALIRRLTGARA